MLNHSRVGKPAQRPQIQNSFSASMSAPEAEEQFLQQNAWANPQHPIHHEHLQRLTRQLSNVSPAPDSLTTPAHQQRPGDDGGPVGSASTIPEHPSAPVSSAFNTPHDHGVHIQPVAPDPSLLPEANMGTRLPNPLAMTSGGLGTASRERPAPEQDAVSSPLAARASVLASPSRNPLQDRIPQHDTISPLNAGITAGSGSGRFGVR